MILIKIGGSIITDKKKQNSFKKNVMDMLSKEIYKSKEQVVIVHGAGSYGHIIAKKYKLNQGFSKDVQKLAFSKTQNMVQKLNSLVLESLNNNKINSVSIPAHSTIKFYDHKPKVFNYDIFKDFLKNGFTPVTYGDVVIDEKHMFSICSGDVLMEQLNKYFKPDKCVFIIDEDGLFTSNPKKNKDAELIKKTDIKGLENLKTSFDSHADVTGGMQGKIDTIRNISKKNVDTYLVNGKIPKRLYQVLTDEDTICTKISGGK